MDREALRLYLATDAEVLAGRNWEDVLEEALAAGVTMLQLRDKQADGRLLYERGLRLREMTRRHGVPLIVNDRVDIMLAIGADGVHVGPGDLPLAAVRSLAPGKIVGYSASSPEAALQGERLGADYLGSGPFRLTRTKPDTGSPLGAAGLSRIVEATSLPLVAIGGITPADCTAAMAAGAAGVCVISAILGKEDIPAAVRAFTRALVR